MKKFVILQSGFKTSENSKLVLPEDTEMPKILNAVIQGTSVPTLTNGYYHKDATELFIEYNKDSRIITSFDFREYLLRTAISIFNEVNLKTWIESQLSNPNYTTTHREFIADTLRYLCTGTRNFNIETWPKLLSIRESNEKDRRHNVDLSFYFFEPYNGTMCSNDYIGNSEVINLHSPSFAKVKENLISVISRWTSHRDGYKDLIYSLYAIFGDRNINY